ncbi:MAG: HAMP domain-containing protein [Desulfohalobiaceae bacterium]|nr:HAMP domain-containing protein [Desulfohalobiaceae bacterium]
MSETGYQTSQSENQNQGDHFGPGDTAYPSSSARDLIQAHSSASSRNKPRRIELLLALLAFLVIVLVSWIELKFFGVNSYLFLAVFNLNLILLLVILFLVIRNGVKLFLDRKRKVRGSGLRSKLVLAFISLSLIPTILMFLVAVKFVQTSVDYWFRGKIESSLEQSLEIGQSFYSLSREELEKQGTFIVEQIRGKELLWGAKGMDRFLQDKALEYGLTLIGVLSPTLQEQNWYAAAEWEDDWLEIKENIDWSGLRAKPRYWSTLLKGDNQDLVVGIVPVDKAETGFLVLGNSFDQGLLLKMNQIAQGVKEYKKIKTLKQPLKIAFYLILGSMTLLIIFGAMWFGFRLAKEISAPIQALSLGTQRIAHGDLGVRLEDNSGDELGVLVQLFNAMVEDLEKSRQGLNRANQDLADRNLELEQRREYMEAVLNTITSGVISLDQDKTISTVNKAAEDILKADTGTLIGRNPLDLLPEKYGNLLRPALDRLKEAPNTHWQRQLDLRLGQEEAKIVVNAVGLRGGQGEDIGMLFVFEDVTELDKMQRMAAWREVAKRIAHEIKNPLTPIKLSAQRLERKFGKDFQDKSFVECTNLIVRQVEHLQQMVQEFSRFARLPEVIPEYNHLEPLLDEVIALFQNSHAQIDWRLENSQALPGFKFDRSAMKQVFINILTNASEVLDGTPEPRVTTRVDFEQDTGWVKVEFMDNGPGLDEDESFQLFEPYFSKKKGNTGLGLTIVKSIVSDHRGYVRVRKNQPRGSVFTIELPV